MIELISLALKLLEEIKIPDFFHKHEERSFEDAEMISVYWKMSKLVTRCENTRTQLKSDSQT